MLKSHENNTGKQGNNTLRQNEELNGKNAEKLTYK